MACIKFVLCISLCIIGSSVANDEPKNDKNNAFQNGIPYGFGGGVPGYIPGGSNLPFGGLPGGGFSFPGGYGRGVNGYGGYGGGIGAGFGYPAGAGFGYPGGTGNGYPAGGAGYGGCSSNFWGQNIGAWPSLLTIYTTLTQAFGELSYKLFSGDLQRDATLLSALQNPSNDPYSSLLREGTAALLNSYKLDGYQYQPEIVRNAIHGALTSKETAAAQAAKFQNANIGYPGICL